MVYLQAKLGSKNPTGLPVGVVSTNKKGRIRMISARNIIGVTKRPNKTNPKPPIYDFNGNLISYKSATKCKIIVCLNEPEEESFISYLQPFEINIVRQSIKGKYNDEYLIYSISNVAYDVGIVDDIQVLE